MRASVTNPSSGNDDFTFFGSGLHGVFKRMAGDFTVTCWTKRTGTS
jgi:hypothetical protein